MPTKWMPKNGCHKMDANTCRWRPFLASIFWHPFFDSLPLAHSWGALPPRPPTRGPSPPGPPLNIAGGVAPQTPHQGAAAPWTPANPSYYNVCTLIPPALIPLKVRPIKTRVGFVFVFVGVFVFHCLGRAWPRGLWVRLLRSGFWCTVDVRVAQA